MRWNLLVGGCRESCGVTPAEAEAGSNVGTGLPISAPHSVPSSTRPGERKAQRGPLSQGEDRRLLYFAFRRGTNGAEPCTLLQQNCMQLYLGGAFEFLPLGGGGSPLGGLLQPVPLEGSAQTSRRRGHLGRDGANLLITSPEEPLLFASPSPPHPQSLEAQPPWKEEGSPGQTTAGFQREGNTASTKPRLFTCQLSPARRGFFASKFFI